MFENNWLTRKWNAYKEGQRIKAHHIEQAALVNKAILDCDPAKISDLVEATEERDVFIAQNFRTFLTKSLKGDDLATFKSVAILSRDVGTNYCFSIRWGTIGVGHGYSKKPLLVAALQGKSLEIAKYIAKHPQTDIHATEYSYKSLCDEGKMKKTETFGEKPAVIAESVCATEIAQILLMREANALKAKAMKLNGSQGIS